MSAHPSIPTHLPPDLDDYADEPIALNRITGATLIHIAPADVGTLRIVAADGTVLWQLTNRGDPVTRADVTLGMQLLATVRQWAPDVPPSPCHRGLMARGGEPSEHDTPAAPSPVPPGMYDSPFGAMAITLGVMVAIYALAVWWLL